MPAKPPLTTHPSRLDVLAPAGGGTVLREARRLPLDQIDPNPDQPRKHFADLEQFALDIAERGVLQPIIVRTHPTAAGRYLIVAGERRWRAAHIAGLTEIPALIREYADEAAAVADTAVENLQRADLTLGEEAALYQDLLTAWDLHFATDLAARLHRPVRRIQRVLQLAEYPALCAQVDAGELTLRDALEQVKRPPATPPEEKRHGDVFLEEPDAEEPEERAAPEKRHGDVFSAPPAAAPASPAGLSWSPLAQCITWLDRTRIDDVPPTARAALRAQVVELRERLQALERALEDDE